MPYQSDDWGYDSYQTVDFPDYTYNDGSSNDYSSYINDYNDPSSDVPFMGSTFQGPDTGTDSITPGNYDGYDWSQGANPDYQADPNTGQVVYNPGAGPTYSPSDTYTDLSGEQWVAQQDGTYKGLNSGDVFDPASGDYYSANDWYNNNLTAANPTQVDDPSNPWGNLPISAPGTKAPDSNQNRANGSLAGGSTSAGSLGLGGTPPKAPDPSTAANNSLINSLLGVLGKVTSSLIPPTTPKPSSPTILIPPVGTAQSGLTGLAGAKQVAAQVEAEAKSLATPRNLLIGAAVVGGLMFLSRRKRSNYSNGRQS